MLAEGPGVSHAATLGRLLEAMEAAHDARHLEPCESWTTCPLTPSIFAVADALDALVEDAHDVRRAALALHDRSPCPHGCPSAVEEPSRDTATAHARRTQARAAGAIAKLVRRSS